MFASRAQPIPFLLRLSPRLAYALAPVLVGLAAWLLLLARDAVARHEHLIRGPVYLTFFYLTVALVALFGGRGPGIFAVILTTCAVASLLADPTPEDLLRLTSFISLLFNVGVGVLLTLGMDAVRRNQSLLAQSRRDAARLSTLMDIAPVGIITCDMDGTVNYANPQAEVLWGQRFVPARTAEGVYPDFQDADGQPVPPERTGLARALAGEAEVVTQEVGILQPGGRLVWTEGRSALIVDKTGDRLGGLVMLTDITERRASEHALRQSEERFRSLVQNASDIITVLDKDGRTVYKSPSEERIMGYTPEETVGHSIFELIHPDDQPRVLALFAQVRDTPGLHPPVEFRIRHKDGTWRTLESVPSNLLEDPAIGGIVVNSRDITRRKDAETEVQTLLVQSQARAEHERLLNHIHQTLRLSADPDIIRARALAALGTALRADRCWLSLYSDDKLLARVPEDWRRDDLPSLAGEYPMDAFGLDLAYLFREGRSVVTPDVRRSLEWANALASVEAIQLRAVLLVPLLDEGRVVASVGIGMADGPRDWTEADVDMAEAVASLMRTATEAAQVQQREHTIAQTLQDALLPPLPKRVPGLELDVFYRPALEESKIGGDFHDVFPLDKGLFALVVGDLSGKGLAAAAQVATVRNLLRYALYQSVLQGQGVAQAVSQMNRVVTEHELLTGFVTLFVAVYDAGRATLTYANCGQEPALLHRAEGGNVEELMPTGPVLGMVSESVWTQEVVFLSVGDALPIFTDGVSEAGRARREFLGVDGVAALLQSCPPVTQASDLLSHLVSGLEAHAQGGLHDDVCLLCAVLEDAAPTH